MIHRTGAGLKTRAYTRFKRAREDAPLHLTQPSAGLKTRAYARFNRARRRSFPFFVPSFRNLAVPPHGRAGHRHDEWYESERRPDRFEDFIAGSSPATRDAAAESTEVGIPEPVQDTIA